MRGIAAASRQQAGAINEVTAAVRQLDEMTQHNAALVEETNAAIEQTESQAVALDGLISVFRLKPVQSGTVQLAPPRRVPALVGRDGLARDWTQF